MVSIFGQGVICPFRVLMIKLAQPNVELLPNLRRMPLQESFNHHLPTYGPLGFASHIFTPVFFGKKRKILWAVRYRPRQLPAGEKIQHRPRFIKRHVPVAPLQITAPFKLGAFFGVQPVN
jgi:hypothetical protein